MAGHSRTMEDQQQRCQHGVQLLPIRCAGLGVSGLKQQCRMLCARSCSASDLLRYSVLLDDGMIWIFIAGCCMKVVLRLLPRMILGTNAARFVAKVFNPSQPHLEEHESM